MVGDSKTPRLRVRALMWAALVGSAAAMAGAVHLSLRFPELGLLLVLGASFWVSARYRNRQRLRRMVDRADIQEVLSAWSKSPESGLTGPRRQLFRATALAAFGQTDAARRVVSLGGDRTWEETVEHRLFLDTLLNALDGDRDRALLAATAMNALPLPTSRWRRRRVRTLREATAALARAFACRHEKRDVRRLRAARKQNPLLSWPLRYAEVLARVHGGDMKRAQSLAGSLPEWPADSVYRQVNEELNSLWK